MDRVWNISRHQLSWILLQRAQAVGVEFKYNTTVYDVDTIATVPIIRTDSGDTYNYDLVIAADGAYIKQRRVSSDALHCCLLTICGRIIGLRSAIRTKILAHQIQPVNPLTAYSINVPRTALAADPDLKFMLNRSGFWVGPFSTVNQMDMPDFNDSCNFCFTIEAQGGVAGE